MNELKNQLKLVAEEIGKDENLYFGFERGNGEIGIQTKVNTLENWIESKHWLLDLAKITNARFINKTRWS